MQQNKIGEKLIQRVTFYFEWRNLRLSFLGSFHLVLPYCYVVHFRLTNVPTTHALWVNTTALKCTVLRPVTLIEMTKTGFDFDKGILNLTFSPFFQRSGKRLLR